MVDNNGSVHAKKHHRGNFLNALTKAEVLSKFSYPEDVDNGR